MLNKCFNEDSHNTTIKLTSFERKKLYLIDIETG
jgi:hypothetical protein